MTAVRSQVKGKHSTGMHTYCTNQLSTVHHNWSGQRKLSRGLCCRGSPCSNNQSLNSKWLYPKPGNGTGKTSEGAVKESCCCGSTQCPQQQLCCRRQQGGSVRELALTPRVHEQGHVEQPRGSALPHAELVTSPGAGEGKKRKALSKIEKNAGACIGTEIQSSSWLTCTDSSLREEGLQSAGHCPLALTCVKGLCGRFV